MPLTKANRQEQPAQTRPEQGSLERVEEDIEVVTSDLPEAQPPTKAEPPTTETHTTVERESTTVEHAS